jgi:hypothetical protein
VIGVDCCGWYSDDWNGFDNWFMSVMLINTTKGNKLEGP